MSKKRNTRWNLLQGRKERKRRIVRESIADSGDLGDNWSYKIKQWELSTGATEFFLYIYWHDPLGQPQQLYYHAYGQLDHAQAKLKEAVLEAKSELINLRHRHPELYPPGDNDV